MINLSILELHQAADLRPATQDTSADEQGGEADRGNHLQDVQETAVHRGRLLRRRREGTGELFPNCSFG